MISLYSTQHNLECFVFFFFSENWVTMNLRKKQCLLLILLTPKWFPCEFPNLLSWLILQGVYLCHPLKWTKSDPKTDPFILVHVVAGDAIWWNDHIFMMTDISLLLYFLLLHVPFVNFLAPIWCHSIISDYLLYQGAIIVGSYLSSSLSCLINLSTGLFHLPSNNRQLNTHVFVCSELSQTWLCLIYIYYSIYYIFYILNDTTYYIICHTLHYVSHTIDCTIYNLIYRLKASL